MGRYVGIDPSTKTGLVILDSAGRFIDGMEITTEGDDIDRMAGIIDSVMDELEPGDIVAVEGFAFGAKGRGVMFQYGLGCGLRMKLRERSLSYIEVAPSALKKFASGKGTTAKENLAVPIHKRWGFEHPSNNVRDAFVLAQIARAVYLERRGIANDLTAFQTAVTRSIINPPSKGKRGA